MAKVILAGILFGLAGYWFSGITDAIKKYSNKWIHSKWLIPVIGGVIIIGFTFVLGTQDYLSLGVKSTHPGGISILSCFNPGGADSFSWLWKLLFTSITIGTGFKGGEVTPLFFIGAALGNFIAMQTQRVL